MLNEQGNGNTNSVYMFGLNIYISCLTLDLRSLKLLSKFCGQILKGLILWADDKSDIRSIPYVPCAACKLDYIACTKDYFLKLPSSGAAPGSNAQEGRNRHHELRW